MRSLRMLVWKGHPPASLCEHLSPLVELMKKITTVVLQGSEDISHVQLFFSILMDLYPFLRAMRRNGLCRKKLFIHHIISICSSFTACVPSWNDSGAEGRVASETVALSGDPSITAGRSDGRFHDCSLV